MKGSINHATKAPLLGLFRSVYDKKTSLTTIMSIVSFTA